MRSTPPLFYLLHPLRLSYCSFFFFFNDTATTEIYTLSLHDALPICPVASPTWLRWTASVVGLALLAWSFSWQSYPLYVMTQRSEEHTSELQSRLHLVCRLLLEKKKNKADCTLTCAYYSTGMIVVICNAQYTSALLFVASTAPLLLFFFFFF